MKSVSTALVGLSQWVMSLEKFYRVNRIVKPKRDTLAVADREFTEVINKPAPPLLILALPSSSPYLYPCRQPSPSPYQGLLY